MADDGDRAKELAEQSLADALADHKRQTGAGNTGPALTHCIECGEEIPEKRRKAAPHCTRCIMCQTDFEKTLRR